MKEKEFFRFLLERYVNGIASETEARELFDELEKRKDDADWEDMIIQMISETPGDTQYDASYWQPSIKKILATETPVRTITWKKWLVAASVAVLAIAAVYLLLPSGKEQQAATTSSQETKDIEPGQQGAILTLADGTQMSLDTFKNATVAVQGNVTAKIVNGSLVYEGNSNVVAFNTMTTPIGRQFKLTLPDGTNVWLNAASSIRYPTSFNGNQRRIEINGEAYFEVAKNTEKPFIVNVNGKGEVEVLGTRFNVNAYTNEAAIYTTLLEGLVRINSKETSPVILHPGEQAELNGKIKINKNIDVERIMAWKNGLINFDGTTFEEIMRQLERWYDIQVIYENKTPNVKLAGGMTRGVSLNVLLKQLGDMGVHYKLENRTLTILP